MLSETSVYKPLVYYTHLVPEEGPSLLKTHFTVKINPSIQQPPKNEIIASARKAYGLCVSVRDHIDREILSQCGELKIISSYGRSFSNIDVDEATKRGIYVVCNDGILMSEAVADLTWGLLLGLARKLLPGDRDIRSGKFESWNPMPIYGFSVSGKKLGIIGMGNLGQAVAHRASGFNMEVIYYQPEKLTDKQESFIKAKYTNLLQLLKESDFITICAPLTSATYHLISDAELQLMKPSCIIVNTSRGSIVDEEALGNALDNNIIAGYAADVFQMEEVFSDKHISYIHKSLIAQKDRTLFTPHLGTAIVETRIRMAIFQAQAILNLFLGKAPDGAVNNPV